MSVQYTETQKCSRHLTMDNKGVMICRLHILASWNSCFLQLQWHLCQTHPTLPCCSVCCPSNINAAPSAPMQRVCSMGSHSTGSALSCSLRRIWLPADLKNWLLSVERQKKKSLSSKVITKVANYLEFPTGGICLHLSHSPVFMDLWQDNVLGDVPWSHPLFTIHMWYSWVTSFTQTPVSLHPRAV